jgi:phage N-6-adenine-methyltransferase
MSEQAIATPECLITDEWMTPPEWYGRFDVEFQFTCDAAADERTHQCPVWFGRGGVAPNGLIADWTQHRSIFNNMPFSDIEPWLKKAWASIGPKETRGILRTVMLLVPSRTDQLWWLQHVEPWRDNKDKTGMLESQDLTFEVRHLPRIKFLPPPRVKATTPRFGCSLLVWRARPLEASPLVVPA